VTPPADLGECAEAVYTAFRRRRSLLLLDLQSQARVGELPWIQALQPWLGGDDASKRAASEALNHVASVALRAFPQTILPNKLIKELRALAGVAEQRRPFFEAIIAGRTFDSDGQSPSGGRRFLGWSVGRHWLLPEKIP
jgi:hypothetical protein